uniref:NACHT domain-containing protein n=1 Tax=Phytoactinopolyspora endophytica TaxID=1642495 RepID=UPI00101D7C7A
MTDHLPRSLVDAHVRRLRDTTLLTALQQVRLEAIVGVLRDDGLFLLRDALVAAEFPEGDARGQDAFQDFRKRVNQAAVDGGVDLRLELDSRKVSPDQRYGWFDGADLADQEIASFAGATAGRTDVVHAVDQEVAELRDSRRTRVYVSFHEPVETRESRKMSDLLAQLRESLALLPGNWEVADCTSVGLGEDPDATRARLWEQADVRVVLVSPAYLAKDSTERSRVLDTPGPVIGFAFRGLPDGHLSLGQLRLHDIRHRQQPWDELRNSQQRRRYVQDLVDEIRRSVVEPSTSVKLSEIRDTDPHLKQWSAALAHRRRDTDSEHLIEADLAEASLRESHLDGPATSRAKPLSAVSRLIEWACDQRDDAPRLCALLGDVGMGKTTTVKLFTRRLLGERDADAALPLPILFDLRDVDISGLAGNMSLDYILTTMLNANRPHDVAAEHLTPRTILGRINQGNTVVIFDGLDEALVHLTPHERQLFTRQLWRVMDQDSTSKLLLTCRTQYFRTIRDETTYFTAEGREKLRSASYLALTMLPFRPEQIREYLRTNLERDDAQVNGFLDTIAAVHNLPDLAQRPLTLRFIADQVEFIERAKLDGRTVHAVDLYREFVDRWLSRDSGKHSLLPEHKQLLMEEIAAELWRSQKNSWGPTETEDWLLELLDQRPDIQRHYPQRVPDLWKADFRTATFLSRTSDTYSFAHRSLGEYLLSQYLCRTLTDTEADRERQLAKLSMPVPSPETLDFLGQSISGLPDTERSRALATLGQIRNRYVLHASELAFAYALHAAKQDHPHQPLAGVQLPGAQLDGWTIEAGQRKSDTALLPLREVNLAGASLRSATLRQVDLTGAILTDADLTNAEFHNSRLSSARFARARAIGTVMRKCQVYGANLHEAVAYRAQALACEPAYAEAPGWIVAPTPAAPDKSETNLCQLTGHTGWGRAVAYSPDGTHLATAGDDHTVWLWDTATGEQLHQLTCHTDWVEAVAYSPDGTHLATAGDDHTVRVWDTATGEQRHQLTAHTDRVQAV